MTGLTWTGRSRGDGGNGTYWDREKMQRGGNQQKVGGGANSRHADVVLGRGMAPLRFLSARCCGQVWARDPRRANYEDES